MQAAAVRSTTASEGWSARPRWRSPARAAVVRSPAASESGCQRFGEWTLLLRRVDVGAGVASGGLGWAASGSEKDAGWGKSRTGGEMRGATVRANMRVQR